MSDHPVDLAMIQAAAKRIEGKVRETPMLDPAPNDGGIRGRTGNRPLLGVRPLIIGKPAPNDGGGGCKTFTAIPQTGVIETLHCVYGNNP
jgi:hypothetical protein